MSTELVAAEASVNAEQGSPRRVLLPFHVALAALVVLMVFLFSGFGVADPDIWWHLNNAEKLFRTGHFPHADVYSFTVRGAEWINHEWLAEIPYYLAWRIAGLAGLYGAFLFLTSAVQLGVLHLCYQASEDIKNSFLVSGFAVLLTVVSFGPRTLIFGWIYLIVLLTLMHRFRTGHERSLWLLPPLFCLWINSHGSWLIGLVIFGMLIASGLVSIDWGQIESAKWTRQQLIKLGVVFALCVVALFLNPYGYKLVKYPFDLAYHQQLNVAHVEEWASVNFHEPRGKVVLIFLAGIVGTALISRRKWKLYEVALTALAIYASFTYVRFLFLAAILVSPLLAQRIKFFPPYKREADKWWMNAIVVLVTLGIIVVRFPSNVKLKADVDSKYPTNAISYMEKHGITGRVFNQYLWGGYLSRHYPQLPVFIDSRTDIFEYGGVLKDYLDIVGLKDSLTLLEKYNIERALLQPSDPLVYFLKHVNGWSVEYEDSTSVLLHYEKRQTESQGLPTK